MGEGTYSQMKAQGGCVLKQGCWMSSLAGGRSSLRISRQRRARSRVWSDRVSGTEGGPLLVAICRRTDETMSSDLSIQGY